MQATRLGIALCLLFVPVAQAAQPCCSILTIDADSGWVTASVKASKKPFLFKPRDAAILASLSAAQPIHADFKTNIVSLEGDEVIGDIAAVALDPSAVRLHTMLHPVPVMPPFGGVGKPPCGASEIANLAGPIAPSSTSPLGALAAVNELQRITWTNFSAQTECDIVGQIHGIQSKLPPPVEKELFAGIHYRSAITLSDVEASVHLGSAPGIRYACLEESDCPSGTHPGFGIDIPVNDTGWSIHAGATINTDFQVYQELQAFGYDTKAATYVSCCKSESLKVTLSGVRITSSANFSTPVDMTRPTVSGACITAHATINLEGAFDTNGPKDLVLTASIPFPGPITLTSANPIPVTVHLENAKAIKLNARLDDFNVTFDAAKGATFGFTGNLKLIAMTINGKEYGPSFGIDQKIHVALPDGIVQALATGLPRTWGENPPSQFWTQRADPPPDFAGQATLIESAIVPHLPWGAVLSIDHSYSGPAIEHTAAHDIPLPHEQLFEYHCPSTISRFAPVAGPHTIPESKTCYRQEFDSAIHTGEYLTAEAFRYAATHSSDALQRIRKLLNGDGNGDGIARLFWVTEDAAVGVRGNIVAVADKPGGFSRTAIASNSPVPLGDSDTGKVPGLGKCYYIHPEGGWDVELPSHQKKHFAAFGDIPAELQAALRKPRIAWLHPLAKLIPVGRTWYGLGCGEGDENPISRDQYVGIFMGLAYAHTLVPDPGVQDTTRDLLTKALAFLIKNNWDVRVPPYRRIPVDSNFLRSWEMQLAFLRIGASVNPDAVMPNGVTLGKLYQTYAAGSKLTWMPQWFTLLDPIIASGFASNLAHAAVGPALMLETDPQLHQNYMIWYNMLRRGTQFHKNAYFNALAMVVGGIPPSQASSPSNPTLTMQEEFSGILAEWLKRRDAVNAGNGLPYNFVAVPAVQSDLFNSSGAALYTLETGDQKYVARYAMPVYARKGDGLDFVWQRSPFDMAVRPPKNAAEAAQASQPAIPWMHLSPFLLPPGEVNCIAILPTTCEGTSNATTAAQIYDCGSDKANQEAPGVDYLLPYWMGVYLHILPPPA